MTPTAQDLAGLIGSRICHDLISPIGAIGNGLELMGLHGRPSEELTLVAESCQNANARIRFFRIAFGTAGIDQQIPGAEAEGALAELGRWSRVRYAWCADGALDRREARLACLLVLCLEDALPRGGRIEVARDGGGWRITGDGPRLNAEHPQWSALASGRSEVAPTAATVQVPLAIEAARDMGRTLAVAVDAERATVSF